ncbi:hypothetical protein N8J89_20505 [Crossiella sp. CA-258035]|nr:hypothetical protein [Crossiella sp. CA-258035]WHT23366.1 hypothetical protein N8J89_20505 [Crossiella sp. CA-258035]
MVVDLLLAGLNTEPTLRLLAQGEGERLAAALRQVAAGVLDVS